jgi:hypothetical protein
MGDHSLALLLKQLDQALLLGDQGIDLGGFVVEEGGDSLLLTKRRVTGRLIQILRLIKVLDSRCLLNRPRVDPGCVCS